MIFLALTQLKPSHGMAWHGMLCLKEESMGCKPETKTPFLFSNFFSSFSFPGCGWNETVKLLLRLFSFQLLSSSPFFSFYLLTNTRSRLNLHLGSNFLVLLIKKLKRYCCCCHNYLFRSSEAASVRQLEEEEKKRERQQIIMKK